MIESNVMIAFENILKKFNDRLVINDFNLNVRLGEKVLIYGKSGIGKSLLFKMLLGFQKPDSGNIYFNKCLIDQKTIWRIRKNIGYVGQEFDIGDGKVKDLFQTIFSYRNNTSIPFDTGQLNNHIEFFELPNGVLEENFEELSGGEKQRLAIIIAIMLNRNVYLLDEATASLDVSMKDKVAQYFMNNAQWTVLTISHDSAWKDCKGIRLIDFEVL